MAALDDPCVLGDDLALGGHHQAIGIGAQPDGPGRDTVAIALEVDETRRRDPLGVLDKAVEGGWYRHRARPLLGPHLRERNAQLGVTQLLPEVATTLFQPPIDLGQILERRYRFKHSSTQREQEGRM